MPLTNVLALPALISALLVGSLLSTLGVLTILDFWSHAMSDVPPTSGYPPYAQQAPSPPLSPWSPPPTGAARPKSRTTMWITVSVVAFLLLCLGGLGVAAAVLLPRATEQSDRDPQAALPAGTAITLTLPETIGSRKPNTEPSMTQSLDDMQQSLAAMSALGGGDPIGGVYGTASDQNLLMLVAFPVQNSDIASLQFDLMFAILGMATGSQIRNAVDVPPGALGGQARCGDLEMDGVATAACAWSDEGSVGLVFWQGSTVSKVRSEFIPIREQVEHKR